MLEIKIGILDLLYTLRVLSLKRDGLSLSPAIFKLMEIMLISSRIWIFQYLWYWPKVEPIKMQISLESNRWGFSLNDNLSIFSLWPWYCFVCWALFNVMLCSEKQSLLMACVYCVASYFLNELIVSKTAACRPFFQSTHSNIWNNYCLKIKKTYHWVTLRWKFLIYLTPLQFSRERIMLTKVTFNVSMKQQWHSFYTK